MLETTGVIELARQLERSEKRCRGEDRESVSEERLVAAEDALVGRQEDVSPVVVGGLEQLSVMAPAGPAPGAASYFVRCDSPGPRNGVQGTRLILEHHVLAHPGLVASALDVVAFEFLDRRLPGASTLWTERVSRVVDVDRGDPEAHVSPPPQLHNIAQRIDGFIPTSPQRPHDQASPTLDLVELLAEGDQDVGVGCDEKRTNTHSSSEDHRRALSPEPEPPANACFHGRPAGCLVSDDHRRVEWRTGLTSGSASVRLEQAELAASRRERAASTA